MASGIKSQPESSFLIFDDIPESRMILLPSGEFWLGSKVYDEEQPITRIIIASFYMGQYPVTQELWKRVMGNNPSRFRSAKRPVECVSWNHIHNSQIGFLKKLQDLDKDHRYFRLPSEAEWEYAAKAADKLPAKQEDYYIYSGSDDLNEAGWYEANSHNETKPVGMKMPNAFGLYDLSGNVWEWCEDAWVENYINHPLTNEAVTGEDAARVLRGGGYFGNEWSCRACYRSRYRPVGFAYIGFRLAMSLTVQRKSKMEQEQELRVRSVK